MCSGARRGSSTGATRLQIDDVDRRNAVNLLLVFPRRRWLHRAGLEVAFNGCGRHGLAEQEALSVRAAAFGEPLRVGEVLDAFGGRAHAEALAEGEDGV